MVVARNAKDRWRGAGESGERRQIAGLGLPGGVVRVWRVEVQAVMDKAVFRKEVGRSVGSG